MIAAALSSQVNLGVKARQMNELVMGYVLAKHANRAAGLVDA